MVTLAAQLAARIAQAQAKGGCRRPTGAAARYCRGEWHRHRQGLVGVRARRSIPITPRKDEDHAKQLRPSRAGGGGSAP